MKLEAMRMAGERGMLLLPMALVLAVAGIAAYAATREGGMSAAAVDARYEYEAARYLAEAGVTLTTWQNAQRGCVAPLFDTVAMGGGTIGVEGAVSRVPVVVTTPTTGGGGGGKGGGGGGTTTVTGSGLAFTTVASFGGATYRIERRDPNPMPSYDMNVRTVTSIRAMDGDDTFIKQGETSAQYARTYIEVSDAAGASAHGLIEFIAPTVAFGTKLVQADLELTLDSAAALRLPRSLSVHRVTRAWADSTTWASTAWSTPGGDYAAAPTVTRDIAGINTRYAFPILGLANDWIRNPAQNFGVLLKPVGMTTARFAASDGTGARPFLVVTYHPPCT